MSANGRVLDVNAYTTLDLVEAAARGPDWTDEGLAVVDVRRPDEGDGVLLEVELDGVSLDRVEPHADRVYLTDDAALTLADALVAATASDGGGRDAR